MTNLYLIRHGEATTQRGESLHDNGLTALGVRQAERLRDRLMQTHEIQPDVFIASTLPRARQTAQIIAPAFSDKEIIFDDEVQELHPGEAENMTVAEFREKFGGYTLDEDPFRPVSPGGETWGQFVLRVGSALQRILTEHDGKNIVVVCHGGVVDVSFIYFLGMETLRLPATRFDTHNTSITNWRKSKLSENRPARWRLIGYNDDMHVRGLDASFNIPWAEMPTPPYREWATVKRSETTTAPTEQ